MNFIDDLKQNMIVADGAMGTLLYSYGVGQCYEALNLTHPEQIYDIHRAYVEAGARLIQTHTYAANTEKLAPYGLEHRVAEINTQAVRVAKQSVQGAQAKDSESRYVFGTMGGIRGLPSKTTRLADIEQCFQEQLNLLLEAGVDGLLLETYYDFEELLTVLKCARSMTSKPIVAQVTLHGVGYVQGGLHLHQAISQLEAYGADVVGLNCRLGPHHMIQSLEKVPLPQHAYLSAYPNASLPSYRDGRYQYAPNAAYFEEAARALWEQGVRVIGGCCGTTPDHIKAITKAVSDRRPLLFKEIELDHAKNAVIDHKRIESERETSTVTVGDDNEDQGENMALRSDPVVYAGGQIEPHHNDTRPHVIVELDPPRTLNTERFMEGARVLKEAGADAITLADNSLASPRISNQSMALMVKERLNVPPIVHIACRDRNLIGLQSHLMGLTTQGLEDVLVITGDPAKVGDVPGASSVYDLSSLELIRMIKQCNEGQAFSGKSLGRKTNFTVAAAFNPNVRHLEQEVKRAEKKASQGADYFLTQPIYDENQIIEIYEHTKHLSTPIYVGVMPLTSYRNAEFIHHEVPGIQLSDETRRRMEKYKDDPQRATEEGLAIAKSLVDVVQQYFTRLYLITPFLRYELSAELTHYAKQTHHQQEQGLIEGVNHG
ncbi:bifunctional homocysteine S-methyltransferase/methylenetetrahydrofolate reductase [Caldalkalibacillus salinus]|uniref:bifunctional homocysteine S-methyltransferase/methylenetetrahydrofolate reductase n=1 Tax=Caldalkalibacillus salinus TaxID=2803787 RepID=UPI003015D840